MNRRELLQCGAAGLLTTWASRLAAQELVGGVRRVSDKISIVDGGGANVLAFSAADGLILVDSGAPKSADKVMASLKNVNPGKVTTIFNTHYHQDQTGNNE